MRLLIQGGKHLKGTVDIRGAKNAAGPLIAASLLFKGPVRFSNVPRITDVHKLLEILASMGADITWTGEREVRIDTAHVDSAMLDKKKMRGIRFSILLLGPMLARFKRVSVAEPGGCVLGNRPIDTHLAALRGLGARVESDGPREMILDADRLVGDYIILPEFSVTATENLVMAAVLAKGTTSIRMAAAEPHVQDLCRFLNASGANIRGIGTHALEITGVRSLKAPDRAWAVIPDMVEVGTFAVAAALTKGDVEMKGIEPAHLDALRTAMDRIGIPYRLSARTLRVRSAGRFEAFKLQTMIYPGFPTDLQAPFGLLATQCHGTSLIHDPLFDGRLGYIQELIKMGANAVIADPHRAIITGPTPLHATEIRSLDLRAGATMVLAGLIAEGETMIHDAEMVYRGYERLDDRLRELGADVKQSEEHSIPAHNAST